MRASNEDRERVARILHDAMGEGRITMQELEERLDTVYAAKTIEELEPVTADLPNPSAAVVPAATGPLIGGTPGSTTSIAVMSGAARKGNWVLPPRHNSVAFWGGVEIDLRNARFAERNSTIYAVAVMGGVDIKVPDDIIVEVTGVGFMGAFHCEDKGDHPAPPPDAPVVRVTGFAFWGAVVVHTEPRKKDVKQIEQ